MAGCANSAGLGGGEGGEADTNWKEKDHGNDEQSLLTNNIQEDNSLYSARLTTVVTTVFNMDVFDEKGRREVFFLSIYPNNI